MADEVVTTYMIDRSGPAANAFGEKLTGRGGVELLGGADDVDDALGELTQLSPDVVLVSTDFGGAGCVSAVESVMALMPQATVVMLSTRGDRALVQAGMRSGAAGSLDRNASPGETITALHVHKRRRLGENLDLSLAEPRADEPVLRVSGALPIFPGSDSHRREPGVEVLSVTGAARGEGSAPPATMERPAEPYSGPVVLAPEPNHTPVVLDPEPEAVDDAQPVVPEFNEQVGDDMSGLRAGLEASPAPEPKRGLRLFGRRRKQKQSKDWGPAGVPAASDDPQAGVDQQKESR